jgi:hypothetical protein
LKGQVLTWLIREKKKKKKKKKETQAPPKGATSPYVITELLPESRLIKRSLADRQ